MIKLKELLTEGRHQYGCVMIYFGFPTDVIKMQDTIRPDHLCTDDGNTGIELEPHCTLLYGLHEEVTLEDVTNVLDKYTFGDLKLHNPSLFENEKFDVLKYDVAYPIRSGAYLHKANVELTKLPHTTSFPDYHPHCTIAYLKSGKGNHYKDFFVNKGAEEYIVTPTHAIYSLPNGEQIRIEIKLK
jgi:2'-5' RNA ligase